MKFLINSVIFSLSLLVALTNCQNGSWTFEPTGNSTPMYSTTPMPSYNNSGYSMISDAISIIASDLMRKIDPWLEDHFYVSSEDLFSGNITQDTIQAWVEWIIDYENNMFYMEMTNQSLPMSYYQQTFDQKYEQLMNNIAEILFTKLKDMFFDMFFQDGNNNYNNNGTNNTNSTGNSTWTNVANKVLNLAQLPQRPERARRAAEEEPAQPPSSGRSRHNSGRGGKSGGRRSSPLEGKMGRLLLTMLQDY